MDIQTRPISDLPEMSKDSQTAQLMVYDEADQTPKRMPRSAMPVFIIFKCSMVTSVDFTISSVSHTPDEVRALLKADVPVSGIWINTMPVAERPKQLGSCIILNTPEDDEYYGGLLIMCMNNSVMIHAVDGSNTWEIGDLPEKSST